MKIEKFEDIKAWQEARELVRLVYKAIETNKNNLSYARSARTVPQSLPISSPGAASGSLNYQADLT